MSQEDGEDGVERASTDPVNTPAAETHETNQKDRSTQTNNETSEANSNRKADSGPTDEQATDSSDGTDENTGSRLSGSALEKKLAEMEGRIDELETLLEDYQRRNEHEHEEIKKYAVEEFAEEMLKVKDSLQDAIEMEDLEQGTQNRLNVVVRQFDNIFTSGSIEKIDPEQGEEYDDSLHRMIDKVSSESQEAESIVEVLEVGYMMSDRVIRPARVVVAM